MASILGAFSILWLLGKTVGDKFAREELGVSGRLRFTSGYHGYYNCSVINKRLISNLKIGIYIHDHTTSISYEINDTRLFSLRVNKIEDFYFAIVSIKSDISEVNRFVKLTARNKNTGTFLGTTILRLQHMGQFDPLFLSNTSNRVISIFDDIFVGSVITKLSKQRFSEHVIFYLDKFQLKTMHAFSVTADGRIILSRRLNARKRFRYNFKVKVRYRHSSKYSSINVQVHVLRGKRHLIDSSLTKTRHGVPMKAADTMPEFTRTLFNFSISELAAPSTIIGRLSQGQENVSFTIVYGNVDDVFGIDKDNSVLFISKNGKLDYEQRKFYKLFINVKHNNLPSLATRLVVHLYIIDENDNFPVFSKPRYKVNMKDDAPVYSTIMKVAASDRDSGNNAEISYLLANTRKLPFMVLSDGSVILTSKINLHKMPDKYFLYILAIDSGSPFRQEREVVAEVKVTGDNLHAPVMKQAKCDIVLRKQEIQTSSVHFQAIDEDLNSKISYSIQSSVTGVSLNSTSGVLKLDRSINVTKIAFEVVASDGYYNTAPVPVTVEIRSSRKNTNCLHNERFVELKSLIGDRTTIPAIPEREISFLKEKYKLQFVSTPGEIVHITEDSQLDTSLGKFEAATSKSQCDTYILYSIASGNNGHKFQIDLFNGTLYLYDKLQGNKESEFNLQIVASDIHGNSISKYIKVKVDITNGTVPLFTNNGYYTCNKTELRLALCKVKAVVHQNRSGEMTYTISNSNKLFTIDFKTGVLIMRKSQYQLTENYIRVEASYGTKEVAHAIVHIIVTGGNVNPPVCLSHQQRIEIATNTPAGTIVGRIFGYDNDDGKAGKITYTIVNKTKRFDAYFYLHPRTGLFRLTKGLTVKDKGYHFSVGVKLQDGGKPMLTTTCQVFKIIVDAIGTYKPVFNHRESPLIRDISSNIAEKAVIAEMTAQVSTLSKINYELVDGSGIAFFSIDSQVGKIIVLNNDFKSSFYWLTVQAYVESNPSEFTNAHLLIRIKHARLKEPYFNPSVYHVTLRQDETPGKNIVQLFASAGYQGFSPHNVWFSIYSGDKNNYFAINPSGWIYNRKVVPVGNYALNMTVANRRNTSLVSHGQVVVQVIDETIKPITFVGNSEGFSKVYDSEGSTHPPFLFQCLAKDMSSNPSGEITYTLLDADSPFEINSKTAVINKRKELKEGSYLFVFVKATNTDKRSVINMYNIQVIRRPILESKEIKFRKKSYTITLNENSGSIYNFRDEVSPRNPGAPIFFYVISGNEDLMFTFPPGSPSELVPVKDLDYERQTSYELGILAFNGRFFAKTKLLIKLTNLDDNPLSASQPCFEAKVMENYKTVDPLITVQVTDPDFRNGGYLYEMMSGVQNKDFAVLNNGAISVKPGISFDREVQGEHVVSVSAGIIRNAMTTFCVIVVIEDANDNKPNFTKTVYEKKVLDSVEAGRRIMAVYATDSDTGSNALLKYSLPHESRFFDIEQRTGVVYVKKNLVPVSTKVVVLDILVQDSGSPPYKAHTKVKIKVEPDFNSYKFEKKLFVSTVKENLKSGSLVSSAIKVNMSMVNYEIEKKKDECYKLFWMDPFSGILLTTAVLDSEQHRNCSFTVNGILHGKVVTSADVLVTIEDVNDNKPVFEKSKYFGSVLESQKSFTKLLDHAGKPLVIKADDFDSGRNGKIIYSFLETSASIYFTINANTGEILTNRVLDYEKHPKRLEYHVKATDSGFFTLSKTVPVSIRLININDKRPEFIKRYLVSLFLPVYNGTFVERVKAVDDMSDSGLTYSIEDPYGVFVINRITGEVVVRNPSLLTNSTVLTPYVTVSDGTYATNTVLRIKLISYQRDPTFNFLYDVYNASITEGDESVSTVAVVNPVGYAIGEKLVFKILNPLSVFEIGSVSGILKLKSGAVVDREHVGYYLIHIEASKVCETHIIARTTINVTVTDINDNPPVFPVKKYFRAFDFDTERGEMLLKVSATDADEDVNAKITYAIKSQASEGYFSIDHSSGEITLKKRFIKRHSRLRQILLIQAADSGIPKLTSETTVEIVVLSKDQPMFTKTYEVEVSEDAHDGHNLVIIEAKGRNNRQVYYEIMSGDVYEMFSIGFTSGELSVSGRLNYSNANSYQLTLKAIDSLTGSWSEGECSIKVLDINDNVPLFEKPFYDIVVEEDVAVGTSILTVRATDEDDSSNAFINYSLNSQSEDTTTVFTINSRSGEIILLSELDAEERSMYLLHVTGADQGFPRKSSFTTVRITVADVNDNPPSFLASSYNFFADSYVRNNQFIGKVQAFDPDINDKLTYNLATNSSYFRINAVTGAIFLMSLPKDVSRIPSRVSVTDGKNKVTVPLNIRISTRNENRPLLRETPTGSIIEVSTNKKEFILNVLETQPAASNSEISFQIDSHLAKRYFSISRSGDLYTTGKIFDREDINEFCIPVRATNQHGMFSLTDVIIKVLDENDHPPLFEFPSYETYVVNSQMSAKSLLEVKAYDLDEGRNAELAYTIQGLAAQSTPIHMNKTTGLISLAGKPRGLRYQFSARVSDNGFPIWQSLADVQIAVKQWNDKLVIFSQTTYHIRVSEDRSPNTHLITVHASLSNKDYQDIYYTFIHGNLLHTKASHFRIHYTNGKIYLTKSLDYERVKRHKLMVRAAGSTGTDSAITYVYIDVQNINDNTPSFDSSIYKINIAEDVQIGESVIRVSARDPDDVEGEFLKYSIVAPNNLFSINGNNGWVKITNLLDRETKATHKLTIVASDIDGRLATCKLVIHLIDINDCPPVFNSTRLVLSVKEDELTKQVIGTVEARDRDSSSMIQYFIKSASTNIFAVNVNNGDISLLQKLTEQSYRLVVIAYDGIHTSLITVEIKVIDVNNHIPLCLSSYYFVEILENSPTSKPLVQIKAEDGDPSDRIQFIIQGDGIGKFHVNNETGVLTANSVLDYETHIHYHFKVVVADLVDHTCTSDVFIKVIDVNDNRPQFEQQVFFATVRENASQSIVLTQVKATDKDTLRNRELTYKLAHKYDPDLFTISRRGVITIDKPLPRGRARIPNFSIAVTATDAGRPALTASVSLQVLVLAVTDTPPKFEKIGYEFEIFENEQYGKVIGNIKVTTSSNLKDKVIEMELINAAPGVFHLDSDGNLSIHTLLDYEMKPRYIFSVKAWFKVIPSLSSMVNVVVIIKDINDHKPKFLQQSYFKQIDENVRAGTFLLQTYAEDADGTPHNSRFSYRLVSVTSIPFVVEANTGIISVSQSIDYESKNSYSFRVVAEDYGTPKLSSYVEVVVNITDLNDNPPIISRNHSNVIVQEGTRPGSSLLELVITDIDSPSNAAPFQCTLLNGDTTRFSLITALGTKCIIQSKVFLNMDVRDTYDLVVRVTDSGTPKQYSDSTVEIVIVKESHYAPVIRNPKLFFVIVSKPYVVTNIGEVKIFDKDEKDIHQFRITAGNDKNIFSIQEMRGIIEGKPSRGIYSLSIEVTDGKYTDSGVFQIVVNELNEEIRVRSVLVTFNGIDADTFTKSKMRMFIRRVASICGSTFENVFIWSVQNVEGGKRVQTKERKRRSVQGGTVIAVAVAHKGDKGYLEAKVLRNYLVESRLDFIDIGLFVTVASTLCTWRTCPTNQKCIVTLLPTESVSYNIPSGYMGFKKEEKCYCDDGTEGRVCYPSYSCLRNPCKFGEKCIQTSSSYRCECIEPSKCDLAGEEVKTFNGNSYVKYILRKAFDELFNTLSIHFRTESQTNAILLYANGKDYFFVEIESGFIQARFDFGSGVGFLHIRKIKVNDGKWHHIQIERYGNYVKLSLDYSLFTIDGRAPGTAARININGHGIVFGAVLSHEGSIVKGFKGCLKQPKLGKKVLPFRGFNDIVKTVETRDVQAGCKDSGMCTANTCQPYSDCQNTITSYVCKCVEGHHGSTCRSSLTCANRPCRNHGICTYTQVKDVVSYHCTCKLGFIGAQCHISMRGCKMSDCQNGATCVPDGEASFKCVCSPGYSGSKCEIYENPCAVNRCHYGGTCINLVNDFKCACPIGRTGKECAAGRYCHFTKCQNGGVCNELKDSLYCSCPEGFTGMRCELDINECLPSDPCQGEVCVNTFGSYYCNCSSGVRSKDCKQVVAASTQEEGFSMMIVVAGGLVVLIIIVVVIVAIVCVKKRKHRYSHAQTDDQPDVPKYPLDRYPYNDNIEMTSLYPPNPPLRGVPVPGSAPPDYFDDQMSAAAAMYDPSALTFSDPSLADDIEKVPPVKFCSRTSVDCNSDEEDDVELKSQSGYHWDYCEVPADLNMKMSREGSRIGTHDQYYSDEQLEYVDLSSVPQLPQRPQSRRSSMQGYSECETLIPELPELPIQVRNSRQSLGKTGNQSPTTPRVSMDFDGEFDNRYSLYDNASDKEAKYIHDILENETGSDITTVTRPSRPYSAAYTCDRSRGSEEGSELSDQDGYTETSLCSDEDYDDNHRKDPLDPENTRKLERDIKRLLKDLQKRTEED